MVGRYRVRGWRTGMPAIISSAGTLSSSAASERLNGGSEAPGKYGSVASTSTTSTSDRRASAENCWRLYGPHVGFATLGKIFVMMRTRRGVIRVPSHDGRSCGGG